MGDWAAVVVLVAYRLGVAQWLDSTIALDYYSYVISENTGLPLAKKNIAQIR